MSGAGKRRGAPGPARLLSTAALALLFVLIPSSGASRPRERDR
jgi:hypothetical protein